MARAAYLPLAAAALVLAACGGGGNRAKAQALSQRCRLQGRASFALLDPSRPIGVTLATSEGSFTIRLDVKDSPCATSSFASLARSGFFDGTIFHRIVPGFVVQGGDPTGTGTGGPGYTTVDPPPAGARYVRGVAAMAKTATEPSGTAGSQFFVVTGADAQLPPDYALLGRVTAGLPVVLRIGRLGQTSGRPTKRVVVRHASVHG